MRGAHHATVGHSYKNDVSRRLSRIPLVPYRLRPERETSPNPVTGRSHRDAPDAARQTQTFAPNIPSPILNFDGVGYPGVNCNCFPPDTNGEVGDTQYAQIVNQGLQVFNKSTGASVYGPVAIATLWSGFGGVCETSTFGDPVILYDQLANRWIVSQFAGNYPATPITDECVAVSTSDDSTGTYNRYAFHLGSDFFDYPKLGVWPDGYYMSMNVFDAAGDGYLGPQPFAFNRAAMLIGDPATYVTTGITGGDAEDPYLPADLDGSAPPPAGAPNPFVEYPGNGTYKVYRFHVDWGSPASSTFSLAGSPSVAAFTRLCAATAPDCVPQNGTGARLDGLGDRLMFRAAYRNFADHESLVSNYSVSSGGVSGVRWFELRSVTSGTPAKQQESTYQPADTIWRWMGSAAMDNGGDLAVGFSASGTTIHPQLRYAGRLAGDAANTLAQGEAHLYDGTGSQTDAQHERWGDYSDLTVDPSDDCTFWYTNEYYATTAATTWRTRIGNFKFAECTASPPPSSPLVVISQKADAQGVPRGNQIGFAVTLANVGAAQATGISVTDNLPSGPGIAWSLGSGSDGGWTLAGSPPSQHLVYDGTALAAGARTHAHAVSATTDNSCGLYANAASFTADSPAGSGSSSATTTVICAPPPPPPPPPPLFQTLTISKSGTGTGTIASSPAGINCGPVCSLEFGHGASVQLSAKAAPGSSFTGWSGDCSGTATCMLSMTNDRSATATFALQPKCVVPKVVGLTLKRAKTRIVKARCRVGRVARKTSTKAKKGRVVGQKPKPGKRLANGVKVNLIVGRGPRR